MLLLGRVYTFALSNLRPRRKHPLIAVSFWKKAEL